MMIAVWIVAYVIVALALAYLSCRLVGDSWPGVLMIAWPFFVPALLLTGLFVWVSTLGEDHHRA